jgi:hypothetical protein
MIYQVGLDSNIAGNMYIQTIRSNFFQALGDTYGIYDNGGINLANIKNTGSTINTTLSVSGNFVCNNVSSTSLFVQGATTVLSTLNVSGNVFLNTATTSNSTLNVSGAALLRSNLTVSGTATLDNLTANGAALLNSASTINSTFNVSGATLLRSNLTVSGTATLNNLTVNGTITGTNFNKTLVGLSNVANTAPTDLPISTVVQSALNGKLNSIPNTFIQEQFSTLTFIHNNATQFGFGTDPLNSQLLMVMDPTYGLNFIII